MAAENAINVEVGGRPYAVARFRGRKATKIMRLAATIGRAYPDLAKKVAEFEQAYIEENALRLSRTEAELKFGPDAAQITDEAWETAGGELALKQMPSAYERLAAIWPEIFEAAEGPVLDLLAVVSMTNEELADANREDRLDDAIGERRDLLLDEGDTAELIELALAGYRMARGQFGPFVERAIPLLANLGLTMGAPEPTASPTSPTKEEEPSSSSSGSSSSETSQSSSTGSPPPTGGESTRSSTESPGEVSSPSGSD
jgi:hypothetical protein